MRGRFSPEVVFRSHKNNGVLCFNEQNSMLGCLTTDYCQYPFRVVSQLETINLAQKLPGIDTAHLECLRKPNTVSAYSSEWLGDENSSAAERGPPLEMWMGWGGEKYAQLSCRWVGSVDGLMMSVKCTGEWRHSG